MAPFHEAINIRCGPARGGCQVYTGAIDPEWTVGAYVIQVFFIRVILTYGSTPTEYHTEVSSYSPGLRRVTDAHLEPGYVLATVVEACIQYQSHSKSSDHRDPIHITAHFLRTTSASSFEVQVRTLKTGQGFTNIVADLAQRVRLHYLEASCSALKDVATGRD